MENSHLLSIVRHAADNMAIPDFLSGAMENWGLIAYRESLLYEEGVTTASTKDWIVEVVAHELTHMVVVDLLYEEEFGAVAHYPERITIVQACPGERERERVREREREIGYYD